MVFEFKFAKSFGRVEPQKLSLSAIAGCFFVTLMYFMFFDLYRNPSSVVKMLRYDLSTANATKEIYISENSDVIQESGSKHNISNESNGTTHMLPSPPTSGERRKMKIKCDVSNKRTDVCEIMGCDIQIHGASSSVIYAANNANESWKIKPYPRKTDSYAMSHIKEVMVIPSDGEEILSSCSVEHKVPGIVFSVGGYTSNFFHSFSDVILPLFLTSNQYNGEVQFFVTNLDVEWLSMHKLAFDRLSNYELIDLDSDNITHCFRHVIVGLYCDKDFEITPSKHSGDDRLSMVDFKKFIASAYSLDRDSPIQVQVGGIKKPRLLIISRKRTRRLRNIEDIVAMAHSLGFQTVVAEAGEGGVANFARIVNSCDVMMGVHGAGLTNMIFLPKNGVMIQVIPLGGLQWWARFYYGNPSINMELKYLEYNIKEEESTLIEMYPRDDQVFRNPLSITKRGWPALKEVFLDKQDVILNVNRFKGVLLEALKYLQKAY